MIIPIGASTSYVLALSEAFKRYSKIERTPEQVAAFCEGFQTGWEESKEHTFRILNNLNKGKDDE